MLEFPIFGIYFSLRLIESYIFFELLKRKILNVLRSWVFCITIVETIFLLTFFLHLSTIIFFNFISFLGIFTKNIFSSQQSIHCQNFSRTLHVERVFIQPVFRVAIIAFLPLTAWPALENLKTFPDYISSKNYIHRSISNQAVIKEGILNQNSIIYHELMSWSVVVLYCFRVQQVSMLLSSS